MWFLSFSGKNDAESLWNFVKILFLDLKRAKFDQQSWFGHARTCPGGQVLTSNHRKYFYFFRFYKYLLQTIGNTFIFSDFTPFHFLWPVLTSKQRKYFFFRFYTFPFFITKFIIFFIKSCVFISKFIIFYKIKIKIWAQ